MSEETINPEELVAQAKAEAAIPEVPPAEPLPSPVEVLSQAIARLLVNTKAQITEAMSVMIAARQLYVVAARELEVLMEEYNADARKKYGNDALSRIEESPVDLTGVDVLAAFGLVEGIIIQAAAAQASQPFDENLLFKQLREAVFPWLVRVTSKHNELENIELSKLRDEAEKERRARMVHIGVDIAPDEDFIDRKKSLTLVGWRPAVLYVLDQIVNNTLAAKLSEHGQLYHVIRLQHGKVKVTKEQAHRQLTRLGINQWEHCARSHNALGAFYNTSVVDGLSAPADLLVVDSLCEAAEELPFGTTAFLANTAHKIIRRFATSLGMAVVGGVLFGDKKPELLVGSGWPELLTHTTVRAVTVEDADTEYKIRVGSVAAPAFTVSKEVLDTYGGSDLIVL